MTKFKKCDFQPCDGIVSRTHPHIIRFHSTDEGFGHLHGERNSHKRCPHCGSMESNTTRLKKMKICNNCYEGLKLGTIETIETNKVDRKVDSFDAKKGVVYYSLLTEQQDNSLNLNISQS